MTEPALAVRPSIGLVGKVVAGVETQFRNVVLAVERDGHVRSLTVPVNPDGQDMLARALRFLPQSTRGTIRSVLATAPLFGARVDAVWTQVDLPLMPWLLTDGALRRVPVVFTSDCTPALLQEFGRHYEYWGGRSRLKARLRDRLYAMCLRRAAIVNPWTEWAARSMRDDYGVAPERIHVLPPGVDTEWWAPISRAQPERRVPRAVFVGGDFVRKGGDLLLDVFRERLRGRLKLDLVTHADVLSEPGVQVHTGIRPNDPRLLGLYHEADFLVIPTRADCFSMAGLEAMSTGLPVVTCAVGGVRELLEDGREGLLVPCDDGRALGDAMEALTSSPSRRARMGAAARALVEARYDATKNARRLLHLIIGK